MAELRTPLGLVLSAGGALGAWQAGALRAFEKAGLSFDRVLGVSAGALNATGYALNLGDELIERWKRVDRSLMRFSPRLFPLSLFSDEPLKDSLDFCADDEAVKKKMRCPLVVVTARVDRKRRDYAVYEPGGRWDGPLRQRLLASCAIPVVFPTVVLGVDGVRARSLDGSVGCEEPFSFDALAGCRDVVVLETVRADELGRNATGLWDEIELRARGTVRSLMSQGAAGLRARADGPRVFRLAPSRALTFSMLSFRPEALGEGLESGAADAAGFLRKPEAALAA